MSPTKANSADTWKVKMPGEKAIRQSIRPQAIGLPPVKLINSPLLYAGNYQNGNNCLQVKLYYFDNDKRMILAESAVYAVKKMGVWKIAELTYDANKALAAIKTSISIDCRGVSNWTKLILLNLRLFKIERVC